MSTENTTPVASDPVKVPQKPPLRWIDKFFLEWGPESLKASVPTLNDVLGKLITLNSALIGGGFLAAKGDVLPFWWTVAAVACLIVSLGGALWGICPRRWDYNLNDPAQVRAAEFGAIAHKSLWLRVAFVALAVGFLCAFAGMVARGAQ